MITATEMTIAARMNGMSYGKFAYALKCGLVTMPPLEEIRAQMVGEKKHARVRPVMQYSLKGEYIATYENATKAAKALERGARGSHNIGKACLGQSNTAYGYQWRFEGEKAPGVYISRSEMPVRVAKRVEKICQMCGEPYKGVKQSRYCSDACAKAAKLESIKEYLEKKKPTEETRICKYCGKPFIAMHGKMLYCSERCRIDYGWKAQKARKKAQNRKASA